MSWWPRWPVPPLRWPTFVGAKVGKTPGPCIRPIAACSASCLAPSCATPPFGLLKGRSAVSALSRKSKAKRPAHTVSRSRALRGNASDDALRRALAFASKCAQSQTTQFVPSEGRVESLRSGVRGRKPSKRRRARDGPSARPHGSNDGRREPFAALRAVCRDKGFWLLLPQQK